MSRKPAVLNKSKVSISKSQIPIHWQCLRLKSMKKKIPENVLNRILIAGRNSRRKKMFSTEVLWYNKPGWEQVCFRIDDGTAQASGEHIIHTYLHIIHTYNIQIHIIHTHIHIYVDENCFTQAIIHVTWSELLTQK